MPESSTDRATASVAGRRAVTAAGPPGAEEAQRLADTFRVLADPGRVRLILALLAADELRVGELATHTGLSETACSHSLRLLRAERVVRFRKDGRSVYYALDDDHVRTLMDVAQDHVRHAATGH